MTIREEDSQVRLSPVNILPLYFRAPQDRFAKETQSNYLPKPAPSSPKVT